MLDLTPVQQQKIRKLKRIVRQEKPKSKPIAPKKGTIWMDAEGKLWRYHGAYYGWQEE